MYCSIEYCGLNLKRGSPVVAVVDRADAQFLLAYGAGGDVIGVRLVIVRTRHVDAVDLRLLVSAFFLELLTYALNTRFKHAFVDSVYLETCF